ncbi:MAG: non-heme iron oxygenase ferredoxin subunit [Patescibacteria group bacterium]|nr:non-heme iron oxygenase ferredoxin subunit [Patescibacteria group bacterium]
MPTFIKAASIHDIPDGGMKTVALLGETIVLVRIGDHIFALSDMCTHAECSLGNEGFLDGNIIVCGCHGAAFDVSSGDALSLPATRPLRSYKVKIQDTDIYVYV